MATLVKPHGICLVAGVLQQSYYKVGEFKYFSLQLSEADVMSSFTEAGFVDIHIDSRYQIAAEDPTLRTADNLSDCGGFFFMSARKG